MSEPRLRPTLDELRARHPARGTCKAQAHPSARWVQWRFHDGTIHYAVVCAICGPITQERYVEARGTWASYEDAKRWSGRDPHTFPLIETPE